MSGETRKCATCGHTELDHATWCNCPKFAEPAEEPSAPLPRNTATMDAGDYLRLRADASLGAALRAAVAETDAPNDCYLYVSAGYACLRVRPGVLTDTDATRALATALSARRET